MQDLIINPLTTFGLTDVLTYLRKRSGSESQNTWLNILSADPFYDRPLKSPVLGDDLMFDRSEQYALTYKRKNTVGCRFFKQPIDGSKEAVKVFEAPRSCVTKEAGRAISAKFTGSTYFAYSEIGRK